MNRSPKLLRDKAYLKIKQAIVTGEYESNTVLYESTISKAHGMSRTPVREALMRLTQEGLVKNLPNHGFLVTAVTMKEIEEIFDLRLCLEKYVIEFVIDNEIQFDLSEMEKHVSERENALKKEDFWASFGANHQFHIKFINLANNGTLTRFMQGLKDKPIQSGYRSLRRGANLFEAVVEHKAIIEALKNRDKDRAIAELQQHVTSAKKRTLGITY